MLKNAALLLVDRHGQVQRAGRRREKRTRGEEREQGGSKGCRQGGTRREARMGGWEAAGAEK